METSDIIKQVVQIIRHELPEQSWQIFLFGSQAKNTQHSTSDIDIGIMGDTAVPLETMNNIREATEKLHTLKSVDVVDLKSTSIQFQEKALAGSKSLA